MFWIQIRLCSLDLLSNLVLFESPFPIFAARQLEDKCRQIVDNVDKCRQIVDNVDKCRQIVNNVDKCRQIVRQDGPIV